MSARREIRLIVSIDTEEDNWGTATGTVTTHNIGELAGLERLFERLGVRATYFTNYQVAAQAASAAVIRDIHASGRAEIGAHIHPWNTPPFSNLTESMLLNLPTDLQAAKLETVTETLTALTGARPRSFRAGRFGLGANTVQALIAARYEIDSSITPFFSWEKYDRGPSHVGAPLEMYRISGAGDVRVPDGGPLIEVPLSCGYSRWHPSRWPSLRAGLASPLSRRLHLPGIASRTGLARPVLLSPEAHNAHHLYGLSHSLIEGGLPFLHIFWHSTSLTPGLSPFSHSKGDVSRLLAAFERLLELLDRRVALRFATISEAVDQLGVPEAPREARVSPAGAPVVTSAAVVPPGAAPDAGAGSPPPAPPDGPPGRPAAEAAEDAAPVGRMGKHTAIYLSGILISRLVGFVMLPFYTHYLTTADYGIMQLLEMTLDVISIMAGTRIASGIHRYYFKARTDAERDAVLATAFALLGGSFLLFGALTGVFAVPLTRMVLGGPEHADLLRIAAVTFVLQTLLVVPMGIVQLWKRSVQYTLLSTGKLVLQLTLNIVLLAVFGLGVKGVFISTLVSNLVIGAIVTALVLKRIHFRLSGSAAGSLMRYGLPLVGTQFATFFVTFGDRYFLRVSADLSAVGLYSLAYQFGFIVASVGYAPFAMIWEPTRFQLADRPDRDVLYSRAFIFMNVIQLVATVGCALFVRDFIFVMSDAAFHSAYLIVPVILAAYVLQSWAYFHEVGILVRERTGYVTLANWVAALVALGGYALLIPRYKGWGAAEATVLAFLVRWLITYFTAQRLLPIRYEWAPVWRLVAVSAVFILIGVALPHPSVAISLAMRVALFAAFCLALWHIDVITPAEKLRLLAIARSPHRSLAGLLGSRDAA